MVEHVDGVVPTMMKDYSVSLKQSNDNMENNMYDDDAYNTAPFPNTIAFLLHLIVWI